MKQNWFNLKLMLRTFIGSGTLVRNAIASAYFTNRVQVRKVS